MMTTYRRSRIGSVRVSTWSLSLLVLLLLTVSSMAHAAEGPCQTPAYRAFDFWLGAWEVTTPDGTFAGNNEITSEEQGCLLLERWRGSQGQTGQSYNFFNPVTASWRQVWVSAGAIIDYVGGFKDGAMSLSGKIHYQNGTSADFRGMWTPNDDGSVTQTLEQFDDDSGAWKTWFIGVYRKVSDVDRTERTSINRQN